MGGTPEGVYLTFGISAGTRVSFTNDIEYRLNKGAWTKLVSGTLTPAATSAGTLEFRAKLTPTSENGVGQFSISGATSVTLSGNCMSLLFGDDAADVTSLVGYDYAFKSLFSNNSVDIMVIDYILPATTLSAYCYDSMFLNSNISWFPQECLPATNLAPYCYEQMFQGCTKLASRMPYLDATTLYEGCYSSMFFGCTSLTYTGNLPATNLADYCYAHMFEECTSLTTIFSIGRGEFGIQSCSHMYCGCTSLTSAPAIVSTGMSTLSCWNMFRNCTSLSSVGGLDCSYLSAECYSYMFAGCTSLTTAPDLKASTLKSYCYQGMFKGCSSLNSIKMIATNVSATSCLYEWVSGVATSGTFTKHPDTSLPTSVNGIPPRWTVQTATS